MSENDLEPQGGPALKLGAQHKKPHAERQITNRIQLCQTSV